MMVDAEIRLWFFTTRKQSRYIWMKTAKVKICQNPPRVNALWPIQLYRSSNKTRHHIRILPGSFHLRHHQKQHTHTKMLKIGIHVRYSADLSWNVVRWAQTASIHVYITFPTLPWAAPCKFKLTLASARLAVHVSCPPPPAPAPMLTPISVHSEMIKQWVS